MTAEWHESTTIQCPECEVQLPESDFEGQAEHMRQKHPEVIAERLAHAARFDGWEND